MSGKTFSVVSESDVLQIKGVIREALGFLYDVFPSFTEDDAFEVKLILSECLFNAVTHGNRCDAEKMVTLAISTDGNIITILISDEGEGFDYAAALNEGTADGSLFKESGRGVRLLYALADDVMYSAKGNEVKIIKTVAADG